MARAKIADIRRREIIEAAYKVFSDKGYHNAGIADIASELEMGHGTFYRYFKNKLDIASYVIDSVIEKIAEVVTVEPPENIASLEEYRESLERIGNQLFTVFEGNQQLHRFLFYEALSIDEQFTEKITAAFDLFASYTEMYLKNGMEKGFLRPDINTRETALAVNSMIFEATRRLSMTPDPDDRAKRVWVDTIIGLMLDGLAARNVKASGGNRRKKAKGGG